MYRQKKITVCLPCRNEGKHLSHTVKRIPKFVDEVIVISNKSTDNTVEVARKLGLKVYEDDRTNDGIGYGYAHMTGIQKATGDIIVGADGDATYPVEDLKEIIDFFLNNRLNFVSCNRYPLKPGTKIPLLLKLGVWTLNTEVYVLYGKKINDILSGMWLLDKTAKKNLALTCGDWNLSPQIKLNAMLNPKINFAEYSIAQHQRMGETHQRHFKTGFSHLFWILKNRLNLANTSTLDK